MSLESEAQWEVSKVVMIQFLCYSVPGLFSLPFSSSDDLSLVWIQDLRSELGFEAGSDNLNVKNSLW